jgi:glutamate-5-semialdehyde dehydrogenase
MIMDVRSYVVEIAENAKRAAGKLARLSTDVKNRALLHMADELIRETDALIRENQKDLDHARDKGLSAAMMDRLTLKESTVLAMATGLREVAALPDPVGKVTSMWRRPNGLLVGRMRIPLGVIGIIYESRPNVTADAAALCLKSGNAVVLRSGSESFLTSLVIANLLTEGVAEAGLPREAVQLVPTVDRSAVGFMLQGLDGAIDVIVPRGGKDLVARVQEEARVPVFAHLEGVCHVYVHAPADPDMAKRIVLNAKMRRTGVCGAAETLLVDRKAAPTHLAPLVEMLIEAGCEVRGDPDTQRADSRVKPAMEEDWPKEFLDAVIAVKVVDGLDEAIEHIARYGSQHTEAIVTDDSKTAEKFLARVDSAIVLHNASTQFADGGEFGMGAEIGIATGRFHARGPVGVEQLTTFKYVVHGQGQIRA